MMCPGYTSHPPFSSIPFTKMSYRCLIYSSAAVTAASLALMATVLQHSYYLMQTLPEMAGKRSSQDEECLVSKTPLLAFLQCRTQIYFLRISRQRISRAGNN
ncbi:hypothetical protein Q1695_008581 [Nippostrongylus brasiliensis]|nr:hypothetical protein Q1695_008581 [Nippostrongylus brasiliensis]